MVQINVDVAAIPSGQVTIAVQLAGLTKNRTHEELRVAEDLYALISILAQGIAQQSGGRVVFDAGPN